MKIEMGKKYQTRDGRPVRLLCVDAPGVYSVVAMLGDGTVLKCTADGRFLDTGQAHPIDLVEAPVEHVRWLNMYRGYGLSDIYVSREAADRYALRGRVARIKLTYKEGQFDE